MRNIYKQELSTESTFILVLGLLLIMFIGCALGYGLGQNLAKICLDNLVDYSVVLK